MDGFAADPTRRLRRVPQQSRSRDRVERILDSAAEQVVEHGVEGLGTRSIAEAAGVPVASLYQYFADKDDILLALIDRDLGLLGDRVRAAMDRISRLSVSALVDASLGAFVEEYRRRPALVMIWLRGRSNPTVRRYCHEQNQRIAAELYRHAISLGLLSEEAQPRHTEIALEVGDRLFEKAFETDLEGDPDVLAEAVKVMTAYLQLYEKPAHTAQVASTGRPR